MIVLVHFERSRLSWVGRFGANGSESLFEVALPGDGTNVATYGYLTNSRQVEHITFHNGTEDVMRTSKQWDRLDRLTRIEHERLIQITAENPATISSYGYRYNLANQRYRVDEADGSYWVYGYDDLGQLTSGKKHFADDTLVPGWQYEYGYDDIGNRESSTEGGDSAGANLRESTYQANELNQYEWRTMPGAVEGQNSAAPTYPQIRVDAIKPGAEPHGEDVATTQTGHAFVAQTPEAFGYDDDGNMTNDGRWTYTWNGENQLIVMETATAAVAAGVPKQKLAFAYDHIGRRTTKKVYAWDSQAADWALTSSLRFLYDGWNLLAELEPQDLQVGEGSFVYGVTRSYVWGLDLSDSLQGAGGIGGLLFATSGATTTMPGCDGNGNVVQYVGTDAGVPYACSYAPFGQTLGQQGQIDMPYRFSSKYADESGLICYGYRYYYPTNGRWLSRDPLGEFAEDTLAYVYVGNAPASTYDSLGLWGTSIHRDATQTWAETVGYPQGAAHLIGGSDEAVDGGFTSPIPVVGDQSYHFNRSPAGLADSRLLHFADHIRKAKDCCTYKPGWKDWLSSHDSPFGAAKHLGMALHPLQDWVAHGDFGRRVSGSILVWHNYYSPQTSLGDNKARALAVDNPDLDSDGSNGRPAGNAMHYLSNSRDYAFFHAGRERYNLTESLTESALKDFLDYIKNHAKPCGQCVRYYLVNP